MSGRTDWRTLGRYPQTIELRPAARRLVTPLLGGAVVVLLSVVVLVLPPATRGRSAAIPTWIGWVGLAFGVVAMAVLLLRVARSAVNVRLTADGVTDASLGSNVEVPWAQVLDARALTVASTATVGVLLREPHLYLAQLPPAKRRVAEANRRWFDTPLWLSADGPLDGEDLVKLVLDYRESWAVAHGQP